MTADDLLLVSTSDGYDTPGSLQYDPEKDEFDLGAGEYGGTVTWEEFEEWVKDVYAERAKRCG